jgi:hypothetical protein
LSLLREIQSALLEGKQIGPILLKLRVLASRLGSDALEEWVKHEAEGYPSNAPLPAYRKIPVSYTGTFSGPFGAGIKNAPLPPFLIEKFAGKHWNTFEMRQSVAAVDELVVASDSERGGSLHINASNLILLLQGKIYEDYACNSVTGTIAAAALSELQHAVRTRVLELTLQIEKAVPNAAEITLAPLASPPDSQERAAVTQITNQVIHGNVTTISNTGHRAIINANFESGNTSAFVKALTDAGITEDDARALGDIVSSESAESSEEPFGQKAKAWIAKNVKKAADGTWKVGVAVATKVLTEAALRYYGFK